MHTGDTVSIVIRSYFFLKSHPQKGDTGKGQEGGDGEACPQILFKGM